MASSSPAAKEHFEANKKRHFIPFLSDKDKMLGKRKEWIAWTTLYVEAYGDFVLF